MPTLTLDATDFRHGIKSIRHAIAKVLDRPVLATMCIDGSDAGLCLVGADNYRIAIYELIESADIGEQPEAATLGRRMVPGDSLPGIDALLAKCVEGEQVTVELSDDHITVTTAARETLTTRLMDGTYPKWRQVIPASDRPGSHFAANPRYLADAARAAEGNGSGIVEMFVARAWDPVLLTAGAYREIVMPSLTGTDYMARQTAEAAERAARDGAA